MIQFMVMGDRHAYRTSDGEPLAQRASTPPNQNESREVDIILSAGETVNADSA